MISIAKDDNISHYFGTVNKVITTKHDTCIAILLHTVATNIAEFSFQLFFLYCTAHSCCVFLCRSLRSQAKSRSMPRLAPVTTATRFGVRFCCCFGVVVDDGIDETEEEEEEDAAIERDRAAATCGPTIDHPVVSMVSTITSSQATGRALRLATIATIIAERVGFNVSFLSCTAGVIYLLIQCIVQISELKLGKLTRVDVLKCRSRDFPKLNK